VASGAHQRSCAVVAVGLAAVVWWGLRGAVTSVGASEGGGMCRQGTAGSAGSEGGCGGRVTGHVGAATTA